MKKTISYLLVGVAVLSVVTLDRCSKSDSPLPAINGYNSSNDVAKDNLLAHWTFDNVKTEAISGIAPSLKDTASSYTTGVLGQALKLDSGYLKYPTITALSGASAIANCTVSAWVNVDNNGHYASSFFSLTQSDAVQADWNTGMISLFAETGHAVAYDDTLVLHGAFSSYPGGVWKGEMDNINDYGVRGTDFLTLKGAKKWVHYVLVYDGAASTVDIYANGTVVSNSNFRVRQSGGVNIGPLVSTIPTQVLIGAFPTKATGYTNSPNQGWQGRTRASIDDIRVFNKTLTAVEVGSLYQLGIAGR